MGLFSSKTITTVSPQQYTWQPIATAGEGSTALSAAGSIRILDEGAIEKAFNFAKGAYEQTGQSFASVLGLAEKNVASAYDFAKYGIDRAKEEGEMLALAYQTASGKETPLDYKTLAIVAVITAGIVLIIRNRRSK